MNSIIEQFFTFMPERRMELIDGKFVIGNWLTGSRFMLTAILADWGAEAAVALAPLELWRAALRIAYDAPKTASTDSALLEWAESRYKAPDLFYGGSHRRLDESQFLNRLWLDFFAVVDEKEYGRCLGRDFTLRIGEDGLSPREIFISRDNLARLTEYYIDGPADIVVEAKPITDTAPAKDVAEQLLASWQARLERYAKAGIPECWIIDTQNQIITFKRLIDGQYQVIRPDSDGMYRSPALPGLRFNPAVIWQDKLFGNKPPIGASFELEPGASYPSDSSNIKESIGKKEKGIVWDELPFRPRIGLESEKLTFAEYISWSPESKFERYGEPARIRIGSTLGTRNVLAMLLMTFGAIEAVKLLPPGQWIDAIAAAELAKTEDTKRKADWWEVAQEVSKMLRKDYGADRIGVIGDLVRPSPLTIWSDIVLITWNMEDRLNRSSHEIYERLKDAKARVDIIDAKHARPSYKQAIAEEMVEI